ncbi:MAG: HypC/HybG/HupF family hydrogenase formation chaperone [Bacteroidetes bacterium]|nr:HypC/HybG/HupF family hydrogenase formation chaperone [Bacteroidota bacterium]
MCLAVPGKVMSVHENEAGLRMAKVNFAGVGKDVCLEWLPEAQVGDYVLVHVGFALSKLDEQDANETLRILRDMGELNEMEKEESNESRSS